MSEPGDEGSPEAREAGGQAPGRKFLPLSKLFPNMLTISGLCAGLSAMRYSLDARWELSLTLLFIAAVIDGTDGRMARLLKSASTLGAQLDSLSDFVCFGVAPAFIMYMWVMHEVKGVGWAVALFFAICCALRLARFNTAAIDPTYKIKHSEKHFTGVPAPAGGLLAILPIAITLEFGEGWVDAAWISIFYVPLIAILMASRIPTFSGKKIHIRHEFGLPLMLAAGFLIIMLITHPWLTLCLMALAYLLLIPFYAYRVYAQETQ